MARVLIINDEPELVEACEMVLELAGHIAEGTTNARTAAAYVRRWRPDVILLDWVLEDGLNGAQILRQIRGDPSTAHIPVMMMSALPGGDSMARSAGADAFLAKPFDAEHLIALVDELSGGALDPSAGTSDERV